MTTKQSRVSNDLYMTLDHVIQMLEAHPYHSTEDKKCVAFLISQVKEHRAYLAVVTKARMHIKQIQSHICQHHCLLDGEDGVFYQSHCVICMETSEALALLVSLETEGEK